MTGPLFPENYSKIWIRGRFITMAGVAVRGKLTLAPTVTGGGLVNRSLKLIMSAASFSADTDNDGYVALQVPATNDPDITPLNFTYSVTTPIGQKFSILVPYDAPILNSVGDPLNGQQVVELIDVVPVGSFGGVGQLLRGIGIQSMVDNGVGGLLVTYTDLSTTTIAMPDTVAGPPGPAGLQGDPGPTGPTGPTGPAGGGATNLVDLADVDVTGAAVDSLLGVGPDTTSFRTRTPAQVKASLALGNVDNTSDADKPISAEQQTEFDAINAERLTRLHLSQFPSMAAAVAAANQTGWCVLTIPPGARTVDPIEITAPGVTIDAAGAQLTLATGSNTHLLTVGPDAVNFHLLGARLDANRTGQSGTSHACYFAPYSGGDRVADRSNLERVDLLNALSDGLHIGSKRVQVQAIHTSIRDFGQYGVYFGGTDCAFDRGAIGLGDTCVYMNEASNWLRNSGIYSATTTAVRVTDQGRYSFITGNMIDNNQGRGITLQGLPAASTLDTTVVGNMFRANSRDGEGLHPDIYLQDARAVVFSGNITTLQTGRPRTSWAMQMGTGVADITDAGNRWEPLAHVQGLFSDPTKVSALRHRLDVATVAPTDTAAAVRAQAADTVDRFRIRADGTVQWGTGAAATDVTLYRSAADTLRTDDLFWAPRFNVAGSAGAGFVQFDTEQTADPSAPAANGARLFTKDNGAGKTQLCVRFNTGATQIIATEP